MLHNCLSWSKVWVLHSITATCFSSSLFSLILFPPAILPLLLCLFRSLIGQSFVWRRFPRDGRASSCCRAPGVWTCTAAVCPVLANCLCFVHVYQSRHAFSPATVLTPAWFPVRMQGIQPRDEEVVNTSASDSHIPRLPWHCCALLTRRPSFTLLPALPLSHPCPSAWVLTRLILSLTVTVTLIHCLCSLFLSDAITVLFFEKLSSHPPDFTPPFSCFHHHPSSTYVSQYRKSIFAFASDLHPLYPLYFAPPAFTFLCLPSGFHYALIASSCSGY